MGLLNLASGTFLWRGYGESRHISEVKGRITAGNAHNVYVFEKLREYTTWVNVKKNLDIPPRGMHVNVTQESSWRSRCGLGNVLQTARRGRENEEPRP